VRTHECWIVCSCVHPWQAAISVCSSAPFCYARVWLIQGADGALDCVAGQSTGQLADSVREGGSVILYGAMGGLSIELSVVPLTFNDVTIKGTRCMLELTDAVLRGTSTTLITYVA
jgi:hypothetical protein